MALKCTWVGDSYSVIIQRRITCQEFGVELTAGSMTAQRRRMHGTEPAIDWSRLLVSQTVYQPQVYNMRFPRRMNQYPCSFPRCPVFSCTWNGLSSHFNMQHWGGCISILEDHPKPLPRCELCGSQVPSGSLSNCHYTSDNCKKGGRKTPQV